MGLLNDIKNSFTIGKFDSGLAALLIMFIPKNKIPKPVKILPNVFKNLFLKNTKTTPPKINKGAKLNKFIAIIRDVTVVPIFAPIITAAA